MAVEVLTLEELSNRMLRLESEIARWGKLYRLAPDGESIAPLIYPIDKALLRQRFRAMMNRMGITAKPIGALALQQKMAQAGLELNEMSRGIIAMRDE